MLEFSAALLAAGAGLLAWVLLTESDSDWGDESGRIDPVAAIAAVLVATFFLMLGTAVRTVAG